jgi:hypothetical protein
MNYIIFVIVLGAIFGGIAYMGKSTSKNTPTPPDTLSKEKNLNNTMENDISIIKKWVSFFGWLTVINLVIAFGYVMSLVFSRT